MGETYGAKWASSFGDEPNDSWAIGLADMSRQELKAGINACLYSRDEWPPILPKFRAMCRPSKRYNAAAYRSHAQLTKLITDDERLRGRKMIAQIKGRLG